MMGSIGTEQKTFHRYGGAKWIDDALGQLLDLLQDKG
jgi:hypothetical protein